MKKKLFTRNQQLELTIDDLAFEGKGISKISTEKGGYIVFTPNTIPGQKVLVRMVKVKSSYAEAKLLKVLEKSKREIEIDYQPIPGAPYITLPLQLQHQYKKTTTIELFRRIGGVHDSASLLDEFIPSPLSYHYRNKMEYSFSAVAYDRETDSEYDGFALGFKKRGQWLAVEPLEKDSGLFDDQLEDQLHVIRKFFAENGHSAWDARNHSGFCRFLTVRKSFHHNSLLINLTTSSSELKKFNKKAFKELMLDMLGERLQGLLHTVNDDPGDRPVSSDGVREILYGETTLNEVIHGLDFRISLESFFQTNPKSAELLYSRAMEYIFEKKIDDNSVVLDLFSGTGTITQLLAQHQQNQQIIGVEIISEAVQDARENAKRNGLSDLEFYSNDVGKFLLENPEYQGKINTLVMDPPRAGIAPKTLRKIIRLEADRMVYISCNPATQARDINLLREAGYALKKYSLVDQFPHTAHIESVALFEKSEAPLQQN